MGSFGWIDWGIIGIYLIGTMAAGLAMRRYVGKVEHFIVAGREMDVYLGIASLAATEFGIITAMYTAELGFRNGFAGATPGILMALAMAIVGLTGFVIKPLRESGALTIPELLNRKFGSHVRWLSGVVIVLGGLLNMGVFLRIGGEFLMIVSGIPFKYLEVTMTVLLLAVLIYTTLGGMLSVLVTDYLQFLIMGVGLVLVSVLVALKVGWTEIVNGVESQLGPGAFNPLVSPEMGVTYVLWQALNQLAVVLTWQTVIQRVLASRDARVARQVYTRTSFYFVGRFLIPAFWGMAALVALSTSRLPANSLHAMPTFLATLLPTGLIGLVIASMLAAEMSTDSSYLLTWSSILYNDIVAPLRKRPFSERQGLYVNRMIILCIGAFLLFYGLWYQLPGRVWDYLSITANIYLSSISVLLVACCYWKRANSTGAVAAIVGGAMTPIGFLLTGLAQHVAIAGLASFAFSAAGMVVGSLWPSRTHTPRDVPLATR
ncbi:MAG TPA: sodium:solute symporter family protein [Terriglobia bacterium]|nr:sodium:solute symporter family protein [Terriglobia bacterium]